LPFGPSPFFQFCYHRGEIETDKDHRRVRLLIGSRLLRRRRRYLPSADAKLATAFDALTAPLTIA
jgi:hypothetical protein